MPEQAPDAMRSLASAMQLVTLALGNYVATAVTTVVRFPFSDVLTCAWEDLR